MMSLGLSSVSCSNNGGEWKMHEIEQLNGKAPRIKSEARVQVITEDWDMGANAWNSAVYYPYMVYMPEKDRLLILVMWGQERKTGVLTSDDHGATWTRLKYIGDGWSTGLTYLGGGKIVYKSDNKYWFSYDYGETWDHSVPAPGTKDGKPFYEDSPFLVDHDPKTGSVTRLWATGKKPELACLLRYSDDGGRTWSVSRHIPQWGKTGEIVLHRANNGNIVAACRVNTLSEQKGKIDHYSGLGVSMSKDNGQTWSELNILYTHGRYMSSMVTLENGDIVLTHIVNAGYVGTADGYPQFGIEAVVSHDNGLSWDLDHRYLLAVWKGNHKGTANSAPAWYSCAQRTATVLLPDGSLLTAFGTGYRNRGMQGGRTHSPQDIGLVRWRVNDNDEKLSPDTTIRDAPFDSDARNVFDPRVCRYAMSDPGQDE